MELQRRGHEVTVLTGFPNYPGGKLYPGYRIRLWQRETMNGVEVLRVPLYPSHDRSAVGRALNYLTFAASAAVAALFCVRRADVAYVYHPPATVGLPALVLRWLRGIPCVYDVQDLWPDTLAATGMLRNGGLLRLIGMWSNFVYRNMDHVVVLSSGFSRALEARGVRGASISVLHNWSPDTGAETAGSRLADEERRQLEGRFNVLFAGNLGAAQGLEAVVEAAALLRTTNPRVQFVFVGAGVASEALKRQAGEKQLSNVVFLPRRPAASMPALYEAADVLLVHLRDEPLFAITIPSKTQTYLAVGRPILMAVRGDAAGLVEAAGAGIACAPGDPRAIAEGVRTLCAMSAEQRRRLGQNGRDYYRAQLDMTQVVSRFEALLQRVGHRAAKRVTV